jgi:hypothetical protein
LRLEGHACFSFFILSGLNGFFSILPASLLSPPAC